LVEDERPSSRISPSTCRKIKYNNRSDTAVILPEHRRQPITAGHGRARPSGTPQGAGAEGAVEFEARVLRGGADQGDRAVLDVGKEAVLLGAVEAVDLVDEQQGALSDTAPVSCGGEDLPQIGHAGEGGRHRFEGQVAAVREEPGDGRFPDAGRPPQDGGAEALLGDHAAQRGVRGQEVVLPDDIFQLPGAQAVGEWPAGSSSKSGRVGSIGSQCSGTV
jgi:hypothetical protein